MARRVLEENGVGQGYGHATGKSTEHLLVDQEMRPGGREGHMAIASGVHICGYASKNWACFQNFKVELWRALQTNVVH